MEAAAAVQVLSPFAFCKTSPGPTVKVFTDIGSTFTSLVFAEIALEPWSLSALLNSTRKGFHGPSAIKRSCMHNNNTMAEVISACVGEFPYLCDLKLEIVVS